MPQPRKLLLVVGRGGGFTPESNPVVEDESVQVTLVKRTTNLSTGANNNTVSFDTEVRDDGGIWVVGDPTKLGPMPALYNGKTAEIHAEVIWASDAGATYRELKVFKNGDTLEPISVSQITPNAANTGVQLQSHPIVLATSDYFELCARSGSSATALYAEEYSLTFSIKVYGV